MVAHGPDKLNGSPVPVGSISRSMGRETIVSPKSPKATADRMERPGACRRYTDFLALVC